MADVSSSASPSVVDAAPPDLEIPSQTEEPIQNRAKFTIDKSWQPLPTVLRTVKISQTQRGLRYGNYNRYRNYCSSKLHRLRKSLGLMQYNSRKDKSFCKKDVDPTTVATSRPFLIPLFQSERCWAFAMDLREQSRGNRQEFPRKHFHQLKKLAKAAKHAHSLMLLCQQLGDGRTVLEAEAYYSWMEGNHLLSQEKWELALDEFIKARTIYDNLSKMGLDIDEQELCKERVEEIDPTIRLCKYNISGSAEDASKIIEGSLRSSNPALDLLKSKLEAVVNESRKKQAESMEKITWRGEVIPLKSEKVRLAVINVQESASEIERLLSEEEKMSSYTKLFIALGDALEVVRLELRELSKIEKKTKKEEILTRNLQLLDSFFSFTKTSRTLDRNLLLASSLEQSFNQKNKSKKSTRPEDLIRVHETIIQNLEDLNSTKSDDPEEAKLIAAKILSNKAHRCFYVALSYSHSNKFIEAAALLYRCQSQIVIAREHFNDCTDPSLNELSKLEDLNRKLKGELYAIRVSAFLSKVEEEEREQEQEEKKDVAREGTLLQSLDQFDSSFVKNKQLANFPPEFMPTACKPTLFDLALTHIEFPSLVNRQKKSWKFW